MAGTRTHYFAVAAGLLNEEMTPYYRYGLFTVQVQLVLITSL